MLHCLTLDLYYYNILSYYIKHTAFGQIVQVQVRKNLLFS